MLIKRCNIYTSLNLRAAILVALEKNSTEFKIFKENFTSSKLWIKVLKISRLFFLSFSFSTIIISIDAFCPCPLTFFWEPSHVSLSYKFELVERRCNGLLLPLWMFFYFSDKIIEHKLKYTLCLREYFRNEVNKTVISNHSKILAGKNKADSLF